MTGADSVHHLKTSHFHLVSPFTNHDHTPHKTITLVPGFSRTIKDFCTLQNKWLAQGYAVCAIENLGAGGAHREQPFEFQDFIDHILNIWQQTQISQCHLVGFSMGGVISQMCAIQYPQKVRSLTLVSTFSGVHTSPRPTGNNNTNLWHHPEHYLSKRYAKKYPHFLSALTKDLNRKKTDPQIVQQSSYQKQAFISVPTPVPHNRIMAPTLIIHGDEDAIISSSSAQEIADGIPNSTVKIYQGCGHLPLVESPDKLMDDMTAFIRLHSIDR